MTSVSTRGMGPAHVSGVNRFNGLRLERADPETVETVLRHGAAIVPRVETRGYGLVRRTIPPGMCVKRGRRFGSPTSSRP